MLSQFQVFYLNKLLSETYTKHYVPYFTLNEMAKARSKTVAAKGGNIAPTPQDHEFVAHMISTTGISVAKALMLYYQLLGGGIHSVREKPGEPEGPKNKTFAWIEKKTDPDEDGNIEATIAVSASGKSRKRTTVRTNIGSLKARLKAAGYDTDNTEQLQSFLHTPFSTWRKRISEDKDAPAGASQKFTIKPFGGDYHATQVAASAGFKDKMDSEPEFAKKVSEMAVRAAANATGISVSNVDGLSYTASGKSNSKSGLTTSDLDDAIQAAILHMSSQSATSPEKLSDDDWLRQKLATGAMNHVKKLTVKEKKERGSGDTGTEKGGGSLDAVADKGWSSRDDEDPDRYSGPPPEDPPGYVAPVAKPKPAFSGNAATLRVKLQSLNMQLRNPELDDDERSELEQRRDDIAGQLELMTRYDKPKTPVVPARKPIAAIPDAQANASSYSMGYDDDDKADAEDILKFRRRMSAEGFTFDNYLKFKEAMGATGAIYDGTKGKDFQWEGDPKSMRKVHKK